MDLIAIDALTLAATPYISSRLEIIPLLIIVVPLFILFAVIVVYGAIVMRREKNETRMASDKHLLGGLSLVPGTWYRVVKEFRDDRDSTFRPGERLRFVSSRFWAYDDMRVLDFEQNGQGTMICFRDVGDQPNPVAPQLSEYLQPDA